MTTVEVDIRIHRPARPWWAPLSGWMETVVAFLPSHPSTRRGRKTGRRIKIALGVTGGCAIVFGPTAGWTAFGIVMMLAMLLLPLPEMTKRRWKGTLERVKQNDPAEQRQQGRLQLDGNRLTLTTTRDDVLFDLALDSAVTFACGSHQDRRILQLDAESLENSLALSSPIKNADELELPDEPPESIRPDSADMTALLDGKSWNQIAPEIVSKITNTADDGDRADH